MYIIILQIQRYYSFNDLLMYFDFLLFLLKTGLLYLYKGMRWKLNDHHLRNDGKFDIINCLRHGLVKYLEEAGSNEPMER